MKTGKIKKIKENKEEYFVINEKEYSIKSFDLETPKERVGMECFSIDIELPFIKTLMDSLSFNHKAFLSTPLFVKHLDISNWRDHLETDSLGRVKIEGFVTKTVFKNDIEETVRDLKIEETLRNFKK